MSAVRLRYPSPGYLVCGQIDGVSLSTLQSHVLSHTHTIGGSTESVLETLYVGTSGGSGISVYTYTSGGTNETSETCSASDRYHSHGSGTLATSGTTATAGVSARSAGIIQIIGGDMLCDYVNGISPEVLWSRYDGHTHSIGGSTTPITLPAAGVFGDGSGQTYFKVSASSDGSSPYFSQLNSTPGDHSHAANTLAVAAEDGGDPSGGGGSTFSCDGTDIAIGGDVNGINISGFQSNYSNHDHDDTTTGVTDTKQISSELKASGSSVYVYTPSGWIRLYLWPSAHNHSGSGLTLTAP